MSNRTDFDALTEMLAEMYGWTLEERERVETELHNAYVAALEGSPCECRWCQAEVLRGNATPWLASGEKADV